MKKNSIAAVLAPDIIQNSLFEFSLLGACVGEGTREVDGGAGVGDVEVTFTIVLMTSSLFVLMLTSVSFASKNTLDAVEGKKSLLPGHHDGAEKI